MLKDKINQIVIQALEKAVKNGELNQMTSLDGVILSVEKPKNPDFGDFAVNVSPLAREAKMAPPQIAQVVAANIDENIETSVVGGFLNFKLSNSMLGESLVEILEEKQNYGKNNFGNGEKVLLEYVSANPTGPLHIGHGRWAAMGSSLSSVLKFSGYDVNDEFYINDAGNQINNLVKSMWVRIQQNLGKDVDFPTDEVEIKSFYPGEYLIEAAQKFLEENSEVKTEIEALTEIEPYNSPATIKEKIGTWTKAYMLGVQKRLMERLNVHFDKFYSELELFKKGDVEKCLNELDKKGELFDKEDAKWFGSTKYGDDQDRVLIKNDGSYTYLTSDIAYHIDKLKRGYSKLINIWGADHHGYVARMRAAIEAMGYNPNSLEVLLGQLVNLVIGGEQVRMGKRKKMVTLEELVDEVGVDATRFWMIMRSIDTTLDFDIDTAKSKTDENPVFYVQYAHARSCSILRNACSERVDRENEGMLPALFTKEEIDNLEFNVNELWTLDEKSLNAVKSLILKLENFKEIVVSAARHRAPYLIAKYAQELAGEFHKFYSVVRILTTNEEEKPSMKAKLSLVKALRIVISNSLTLLGVSSPESM